MKWSTVAAVGLFVVSTGLFAYSVVVSNNNLDTSGPEIHMEVDRIEMSITDDEDKILEGITASDSRDGDVTDSLVVESLSNFIERGVRKASIVAFDQDNHIARVTREVVYTDYESPRFQLEGPLRFNVDNYNFLDEIQAVDCIEGDLSAKIHLTYDEEYEYGKPETKATLSVANSMGDSVTMPVTISTYVNVEENQRPVIELKSYLIYVESGKKVKPMKYLKQITMSGKTYKNKDNQMVRTGSHPADEEPEVLGSDLLTIDNPVTATPGTYEISYTVRDPKDPEDSGDDMEKTIRLIVVVTEPKE